MMIAALLLLLTQQQPKHKIEPRAAIEATSAGWGFRITGKTDLPDGTILKLRVFAIDVVDLPSGRSEEEQELKSESWTAVVKDGTFDELTLELSRRPFSLTYRARVAYNPVNQEGAIARAIGDRAFDARSDIAYGDRREFADECKTSAKELYEDLVRLRDLMMELQVSFTRQREKPEPKSWAAWTKPWYAKVQKIATANDRRFDIWSVWIEKQGRMRVGGFCERLGQMSQECERFIGGEKGALDQVRDSFTQFMEVLEEAFELPGLELPIDVEKLRRLTTDYAEAVAALRALSRDAWTERSPLHLAAARGALLQMSNRKVVPRRKYDLVAALADRFDALSRELASGNTGAAAAAHDAALRALKSAAGIE
jgi:hypothetical protein